MHKEQTPSHRHTRRLMRIIFEDINTSIIHLTNWTTDGNVLSGTISLHNTCIAEDHTLRVVKINCFVLVSYGQRSKRKVPIQS